MQQLGGSAGSVLAGRRSWQSESAQRVLLDKPPVQIDVVAGILGFDTGAYSIGYIAGWAPADADLIRLTAARVLTTAHQIAGILTPETA